MTPTSNSWYAALPGRHYPRPPIKEALIDIQVALPAAVEVESLSAIHEEIKHEFPLAKKRFFLQAAIPLLEGDGVGLSTRQHRGYSFYSADGRYAFQARLDGFTFGRLSPYDSWQDLRDSAKGNWALFEKHARQAQIERVAVRYINQIDIPTPSAKLDEYFLTPPRISPLLPQELSQYLMQVQIPQPDIEGIAVLTQTLVVPPPVRSASASVTGGVRATSEISHFLRLPLSQIRQDPLLFLPSLPSSFASGEFGEDQKSVLG